MFKLKKVDTTNYLFSNRALIALIIPLVIEQFLATVMGMVDSVVASNIGEAAMSGISLVDQIMILMINIFAALATGGAVVAGQYLGQQKKKEGCEAATQLIYFVLIVSVIITGLIYLVHNAILKYVFGQIDANVMHYAKMYLLILTASIPFIAVYNGGAAIFRAMGNSRVTMVIMILMNIINLAGDLIFVFGLKIGSAGVALPTLFSRILAAVVVVVLLLNQDRMLHIKPTVKIRLSWPVIKKILRIGVPNGLENSMFQLGKILVLSLVATFGTAAIAANSVGNVLAAFQVLPGGAVGLAVTAVISRCIGAGDYKQVRYYSKRLIMIAYVLVTCSTALIYFSMPLIMKIYHLTPQTRALTENIVLFYSIFAVTIWSPSFVTPNIFRAAGDVKACMIIAIFSMWIFRIGFAYLLGKYLHWGLVGVWFAMFIDWLFRGICFVIRYVRGTWMNRRVI